MIYWYNPNKKIVYPVYYSSGFYLHGQAPGYINGHGHELLAIIYIDDKQESHVAERVGLYYEIIQPRSKPVTKKDKLIDYLIEKLSNCRRR